MIDSIIAVGIIFILSLLIIPPVWSIFMIFYDKYISLVIDWEFKIREKFNHHDEN